MTAPIEKHRCSVTLSCMSLWLVYSKSSHILPWPKNKAPAARYTYNDSSERHPRLSLSTSATGLRPSKQKPSRLDHSHMSGSCGDCCYNHWEFQGGTVCDCKPLLSLWWLFIGYVLLVLLPCIPLMWSQFSRCSEIRGSGVKIPTWVSVWDFNI